LASFRDRAGGALVAAQTVLVVGASRGIGLEFARQYAAAGARVIGTFRAPADAAKLQALGAHAEALDLLDAAATAAFGARLAGETLHLAILCAGVYGPRSEGLAVPSDDDFDQVMHTNVRAPMRLIPLLAPALRAGGGRLAVLSSRMGSVSLMQSTAGWLYRASKAAVNSVLKTASIELGPQGIVCLALHPGWVRTDMGGAAATLEATDSVAGMRRLLAAADASFNGRFFNYDGTELTW
jgi:NAD(P)-dependent dehydrogenase (short-subunit alcohol dehydrogenase family)